MMAPWYVHAGLLTGAVDAASRKLFWPVKRVVWLGDGGCRVQGGPRWITIRAAWSDGGVGPDGAVMLGGGGWRVRDIAEPLNKDDPRDTRADMLCAVINHAAGELQLTIESVTLIDGARRFRVIAGPNDVIFQATWRPPEPNGYGGWWDVERLAVSRPRGWLRRLLARS